MDKTIEGQGVIKSKLKVTWGGGGGGAVVPTGRREGG